MRSLPIIPLIFLPTLFLACGDSGNGNISKPCPAFTPCGGDVVGRWKATSGCTNGNVGNPSCTVEFTPGPNYRFDETLVISSDGTYTMSSSGRGNTKFTYAADCFTSSSESCESMDAILRVPTAAESGMSGSCVSTSEGGCACTATVDTKTNEAGSYSVSGSSLALVATASSKGRGGGEFEYCVQGNELTLHQTAPDTMGIFLTRQ